MNSKYTFFPNRHAWGIRCLSEVSSGYRTVDTSRLPLHACLCMHNAHECSDAALSIWWVAQRIQSTEAASQVEECCKVNCGQKKKEERSFSTDDGRSKLNSSRPFHAIIRKLTYLQTTLLTDYSSKTVAFLDYIRTHLMSVCWISSSLRWTCFKCSGLSPILPQPTAEVSASRGKRSNFRVNDLYMPRQSLCVILTHDIYFNLARLMQWIEKCAQIHAGFCTLGMSIFLRAYWLHSTRRCRVDYPSWSSLPRQKRARVRAPVSIKHSKSVLPESVTWQH